MTALGAYTLTKRLGEAKGAFSYRARRNRDGLRVVLKVLDPGSCRPQDLERLKNEFELQSVLDGPGLLRPIALETVDGMPVLVTEDFPGDSLELQREPMAVGRFLDLAVRIVDAVEQLHARDLVHRDLRPENILVSRAGAVRIRNFGGASRLPGERTEPPTALLFEGALPYLSPEQTGRMNRPIDSRSDLYSLGVTFYQLLSGRMPFEAHDALGWVHAHLACAPAPLSEIAPSVPEVLSRIVLRLLAKLPDDRYQTAWGLRRDLERCALEWRDRGAISSFPLGAEDWTDRLLLSGKLYGREAESAVLSAAFDRMVSTGEPVLMLVSGEAGVGKSSLIANLHIPTAEKRGFFATGKFEPHDRAIPYFVMAQACRKLVLEVLSGSTEAVGRWRALLGPSFGPNAQILVDLIPEVAQLVGATPAVPELPPAEAENRLLLVFRRFFGAFASAEHPVTLFLDDLQWADGPTLRLLEELMTQPDTRYLLLVSAYRDDAPLPPSVARMLERARASGALVKHLTLEPLSIAQIGDLVADAVRRPPIDTEPLARLVHKKTDGNPLFAVQFLTELAHRRLLALDPHTRRWQWDVARLASEGFTDNVVNLMVGRLKLLPKPTQDALRLCACLGGQVESATLSAILDRPAADIPSVLRPAFEQELLLPIEGAFRFAHDRVREAAYCLIPKSERASTHLKLGRTLLSQMGSDALDERLFGIVNQFNLGAARIESDEERHGVADLNLRAGNRAKGSGAYASGVQYFAAGSALLEDQDWERRHDLFFALELGRAECAYLEGHPSVSEAILTTLARRARDNIEAATATSILIRVHIANSRSDEAVEAGVTYLHQVGLDLSPHPPDSMVADQYAQVSQVLRQRPLGSLLELPLMSDPTWRAATDVLQSLIVAALNTDANLLRLLPLHIVQISLREGHCDASCFGYACLAALLGNVWGDFPQGAGLGQLARDLVEKRGLRRYDADVFAALASAVVPWSEHVRVCGELHQRSFDTAIDKGKLDIACYGVTGLATDRLFAGDPLSETLGQADKAVDFCGRAGFLEEAHIGVGQQRLALSLLGKTEAFGSFRDRDFDEGRFEASLRDDQAEEPLATCWYFVRKLQARFMAGSYGDALDAAANAEPLAWSSPAFLETVELAFYSALAAAAYRDHAGADQRGALREHVAANERRLAQWAAHCPQNFLSRHLMVSAEAARLDGQPQRAAELYEQAVRAARRSGFVNDEALAYELASRLYRERGVFVAADAYLREARSRYVQWGAIGKVSQIDRLHPGLLEWRAARAATVDSSLDRLDLLSALRASHAIARTHEEGEILQMLLQSVLEEGAARTARLVFVRGDELTLEAEAVTDERAVPPIRTWLAGSTPVSPEQLPLSIVGTVRRTREAVTLDDACAAEGPFASDPYVTRARTRSVFCLPVLRKGQVVALLVLENDLVPGAFTRSRRLSLELLATQSAISIENAQLLERERAARFEARFVAEASKTLAESLDYETTLARVARLAVPTFADWCTVYLGEDGGLRRVAAAHFDPDKASLIEELRMGVSTLPETHPMMRAFATGTSFVQSQVTHDFLMEQLRDPHRVALVEALGTRSFVAAPLAIRGHALGAMSLCSAQPLRYGPETIPMAEEIARRAAVAIENARLYKESQDSIRARDEFLAIASHELRTPVTSSRLMVQAIRSGTVAANPANISRAVELFDRQMGRLARLVEDMLNAGRILVNRLEIHAAPMDLGALVREEVERSASAFATARCKLTLQAQAPVCGCWDQDKLAQVVANLVDNAIKFGAGKPIEIAVEKVGSTARLVVVDHGIGIDAEAFPRIFERFDRAVSSRSYGGLGLGLYIARHIVQALGGTVRAESTPNVETRFIIDLPIAA